MSSLLQKLYFTVRGVLIVTPWLAHLLGADILLSGLLPLSAFFPAFTYNASSRIAEGVWSGIQRIFTRINGAKITLSGSELFAGESAIVVANHIEWTDFYMLQALALRSGMLGRCRYFAKQQLKWVPFLGWGLWAMGMPLVTRNWMQDKREMDNVFARIVENELPIWLISFSEATRYTPEKYTQTVNWCKANNKAVPKHTLHPRTKGFIATVKQLRNAKHVKAVYDVTLAYAHGNRILITPSFWESLSSSGFNRDGWRFHAHVQRFPIETLPHSDSDLASWLETRWIEKGKRLDMLRDEHARGIDWKDDLIIV